MPQAIDTIVKYGGIKGSDLASRGGLTTFSTSVEGIEGTGKTYYALVTCPTPIVHVNFGDRDAKAIVDQLPPERAAEVVLYNFFPESPEGWTRQEGQRHLVALKEIVQAHLGEGRLAGGTFVLDSGSSWWEVIQEVHVAPLMEERQDSGRKRTGGLEYMPGNLIVNGVINWVKNQGCFVVLTHRKRQDWGASGPIPGSYSAQLNRKVPYLVEVRLDLHKYCAVCGGEFCEAPGHMGRRHVGRVIKLGSNTALEGIELEPPSFEAIYKLYAGRDYA